MHISVAIVAGIIIGIVIGRTGVAAPAQAQSPEKYYEMAAVSASGTTSAYLLNMSTGEVEFCVARQCVPALHLKQ
jgi:hypothetical protein